MRLRVWLPAACLVLAAAPLAAESARSRPSDAGIPVARLAFADEVVERQLQQGEGWERLPEGATIRTGDRIRTGPQTTARIEFPWMNLVVGSSSVVSIPPSRVLSTVLEEGRVEQRARGGGDVIKLRTRDALVRGAGWVVVRHNQDSTGVIVYEGRFRVEAAGRSETVREGHGSLVAKGRPPSQPVSLPQAPTGLHPGADPVYVSRGAAVTLSWSATGPAHHLQVLRLDTDEVLLARDVGDGPVTIEIPWAGTFRWRVSARDDQGLDGLPSKAGFVCVVDQLGAADRAGYGPRSRPRASSASRRTSSTGS